MPTTKLLQSLPQAAYSGTQVLAHEAEVATEKNIEMYDLMEKAGLAFFSHLDEQVPELSNMLVLVGKGNNGGDGLVVARLAYEQGINVTIYLCAEVEQITGHAKTALDKLTKTNITFIYQSELTLTQRFLADNHYQLIVDGIFGIGFKGELDDHFAALVATVNQSNIPVYSIDVPSGLNSNTGDVGNEAIIAKQTLTFIVAKQGLLSGQAAKYVGELFLATLSLNELFQRKINASVHIQGDLSIPEKPQRSEVSHKGNIGLLLAIGGSQGLPGAIRLAGESALRSGASLVAVSCHQDNHQLVLNGRPELMLAPDCAEKLYDSPFYEKAKVLLIGPGLGQMAWSRLLFDAVIKSDKPMVVDADALQILSNTSHKRDNWVLTPHPGEAAKLLNCSIAEIEQDRFHAVKAIAKKYGGICILKGAGTLISDGEIVWINSSGNSGMATGGMGDVLSGIIAALMMQVPDHLIAARLAVYVHGKAADNIAQQHGKIGMLASDLFVPIQQLLN